MKNRLQIYLLFGISVLIIFSISYGLESQEYTQMIFTLLIITPMLIYGIYKLKIQKEKSVKQ